MTNHKELYLTDEDGIRLHIKLERAGTGRTPLVILIHGFTGHMEEPHILGVRDACLECGYSVLRAEMYGHGKSDGKFRDHTLFKWMGNLLTVINYAKRLDFVTKLCLCGHSQGGLAVMLAAGVCPELIDALIPLSPGISILEDIKKGKLLSASFDPVHIPETIYGDDWELGSGYIRTANMILTEPVASRFEGPVLLVHGTADESVPAGYSERASGWYRNCRLVEIEGDTHCYDFHLDEVQAAVSNFLGSIK